MSLQESLLSKKLLHGKNRKDGTRAIVTRVALNRALKILHEHKAITKSFRIDFNKIPPGELERVKDLFCSLKLPFTTITPVPRDDEIFNVRYVNDSGPLYAEFYGGDNVDGDVWFLTTTLIEKIYGARVLWVGENEIVWHKSRSWNKLAKIMKDDQVIGLVYRLPTDNMDRKQIRADIHSTKILVQYNEAELVTHVWIYCPKAFKEVAKSVLENYREQFTVSMDLTTRKYYDFLENAAKEG